jgi:hypothetical protein
LQCVPQKITPISSGQGLKKIKRLAGSPSRLNGRTLSIFLTEDEKKWILGRNARNARRRREKEELRVARAARAVQRGA